MDDIVFAVHEMAANAIVHGGGRGRLRLDAVEGGLQFQVSDDSGAAGTGVDEEARPGLPAGLPWPVTAGHGLWFVGQLADALDARHGPAGTTITMVFLAAPAALGSTREASFPWSGSGVL